MRWLLLLVVASVCEAQFLSPMDPTLARRGAISSVCALTDQDLVRSDDITISDSGSFRVGIIYTNQTAETLCQVDVMLTKYLGNITGKTYYLEVWSVSGKDLGTRLASKSVTGNNSWLQTWVPFAFSSSVSLATSTAYAISITTSNVDDSNTAAISYSSPSSRSYIGLTKWNEDGTFIAYYGRTYGMCSKYYFTRTGSTNLTDGLLSWWTLDTNNTSSGSGNVKDSSGNKDGTENGTITVTNPAVCNEGLTLDGSTGYISTPSVVGPQSAGSWCCWINVASLSAHGCMFSQYDGDSSKAYLQVFFLDSGTWFGRIQQTFDSVYIQRTSNSGVISTGGWHHFVMTWDGGTTDTAIKLYVDANQVDTTSGGAGTFTGPSSDSIPFWIGAQKVAGGPSSPANASFDDVRIYNRALSTNEITYLKNWRP